MRKSTAIILHACSAMVAANSNEFDMLLDKLSDRALDMPTHHADLEKTTLGKTTVGAKPGMRVQIFPPASSSAMRGMTQVQVMQNTLQKYGIGSSPIQKLALTQLAATRDASMNAQVQVKDAFLELDPKTQGKLQSISKEVIVRANAFESLKKEDMPGVTAPLGFWDPLKLAKDAPEGRLYFFREAELKNGRTAMMAVLGLIVTDKLGIRPFYEGAEPYVSPVQSHFNDEIASHFWPSLAIACGFAEIFSYPEGDKGPGDLGFDPLGLTPKSDKDLLDLQNREINNGRLAMVAYAGIIGKELLTGSGAFGPSWYT